jgi:hypothetical protein
MQAPSTPQTAATPPQQTNAPPPSSQGSASYVQENEFDYTQFGHSQASAVSGSGFDDKENFVMSLEVGTPSSNDCSQEDEGKTEVR